MISASPAFAQSSDVVEGEQPADPDVIAVEEFVRELRESANEGKTTAPDDTAGKTLRESVPIDGSSPPRLLLFPLLEDGRVIFGQESVSDSEGEDAEDHEDNEGKEGETPHE